MALTVITHIASFIKIEFPIPVTEYLLSMIKCTCLLLFIAHAANSAHLYSEALQLEAHTLYALLVRVIDELWVIMWFYT